MRDISSKRSRMNGLTELRRNPLSNSGKSHHSPEKRFGCHQEAI